MSHPKNVSFAFKCQLEFFLKMVFLKDLVLWPF